MRKLDKSESRKHEQLNRPSDVEWEYKVPINHFKSKGKGTRVDAERYVM